MAEADLTGVQDPSDKNYFDISITGLQQGKAHYAKFQWVFSDPTINDKMKNYWSANLLIPPYSELLLPKPNISAVGGPGYIAIEWDGKSGLNTMTNIGRVDVYITGGDFNDKVAYSFLTAGKTQIPAEAGEYFVEFIGVSKSGITGNLSDTITVTVLGIGQVVETPTLPTGLTAEAINFGLRVNWDGTYQDADTFSGFKSINIYAVNTNLGASTTTGITAANQVAVLSVNDTKNSSNISLGTYVGYSIDTYLYYISTNVDGTVYKTGTPGVATYTRINSTALRPTKANKIDLENGVISIENLEAGNGQFNSWLRAGAWDGARIEISGLTSNLIDPNHATKTILPGLHVYGSNGTTPILSAPLTGGLSISGDGEFGGSLSIGTGNNVFKAEPATGIWLGDADYADADFRVSNTGIMRARGGSIAGWIISTEKLADAATNPRIELNSTSSQLKVAKYTGSTETASITLNPTTGFRHSGGNFTLDMDGNLTLTGIVNVTGGNAVKNADLTTTLASYLTSADAQATFITEADADIKYETPGGVTSKLTLYPTLASLGVTGSTVIDGGRVTTGVIKSGNYAYSTGYFSTAGTSFSLDYGALISPGFSIIPVVTNGVVSAYNAYFAGTIVSTGMYLGSSVSATDKILSNGVFSLGSGALTYSGSGDINLNGASLQFTGASNVIFGDDNNYGGDATVVLNQNAQLTKGRAFHYGGTTIPNSSNTYRAIWNSKYSRYDYPDFVAGDIWMTVD